jgi:hypothetical protein
MLVRALEPEKGAPRRGRRLLGLPLGFALYAIAALASLLIIGAIIGAVIGTRRHGTTPGSTSSASPSATVTSTHFSGATASNLPLGKYDIPTDTIKESGTSCVVADAYAAAWGCESYGEIGIDVSQDVGGDTNFSIVFDQYPLNSSFTYGPQLPNLGGQAFQLYPELDANASNLGPAFFFVALYDKLVICESKPNPQITHPQRF